MVCLGVLVFGLLPGPRPATLVLAPRAGNLVCLGAGGDSGRRRGRGDDVAVSPIAPLTCASRPRRHSAARACSEDLGRLTVPQLKERLRDSGLKVSGRKAELVRRLHGSSTRAAASIAEAHGATVLHLGASLPSATFSVVHSDESLLVVDKGAGLLTVPGIGPHKADLPRLNPPPQP